MVVVTIYAGTLKPVNMEETKHGSKAINECKRI